MNTNKSHNDRIVNFKHIHRITAEHYEALLIAIDPREGDLILEGCAGYADVSRQIIEATNGYRNKPVIYLVEESPVQIARVSSELQLPEDRVILGDVRQAGLPAEKFDTVIIKMGVHELPKDEQSKVFTEMYRILKPGGKFIIWGFSLTHKTQEIFQKIVRKKDELSRFESMVINRYFQRHDELQVLFDNAGFKGVKDEYKMRYTFDPKDRLEELISRDRLEMLEEKKVLDKSDEEELQRRAQERVTALVAYVRELVTNDLKEALEYKDLGDSVEVTFDQIIMSGKK